MFAIEWNSPQHGKCCLSTHYPTAQEAEAERERLQAIVMNQRLRVIDLRQVNTSNHLHYRRAIGGPRA